MENQPLEEEFDETNTWVTLDNIEPTNELNKSKEIENSSQNLSLENLNNTLDNPHPEQKPEEERECPCGNKYPPIFIKNKPKYSIDDWIECENCKSWSGETISSQSFVCSPCLTKQIEALQNSSKNLKQNSCLNFENKFVWEHQGVHEDPKHVFFSYGFSGPIFNVDYGKSCSQAQIKVEQVTNSIFVGGRMSKIAQISRNCPRSY